jgi:hypothetical protein
VALNFEGLVEKMFNMNYPLFENTYLVLCDCVNHMEDDNLSQSEKEFRKKIIELSKEISEFDEEILDSKKCQC